MALRAYLAILSRRIGVVGITVAVTGLITAIGMLLLAPAFVASATLRLSPAVPGSVDRLGWDDIQYTDRLANTYRALLVSDSMRGELARRLGLDEPPKVEVEIPANTELLQIAVEHEDPALAAEAANSLADMLIAQVKAQSVAGGETARQTLREQLARIEAELSQLRRRSDAARAQRSQSVTQAASAQAIELREGVYAQLLEQYERMQMRDALLANSLAVIRPAVAPATPASPRPVLVVGLGLLVGLVGGLGLAFLFENLDTTLHTTRQIEDATTYAILGAIPAARRSKPGRLFADNTPQEEAFRRLRTNILHQCQGPAPRTLLITSAEPGEGTSTVAANLARSLAQSGRAVVMVDGDMRLPAIHSIFGLPNELGLSNILQHNASPQRALQRSNLPGLSVLTSGPPPPSPADLVESQRMDRLITELGEQFDIVLLDAPALLVAADAAALARSVDGVVQVVGRGRARQESLRAAAQQLAHVRARPLGIVVNRAEHDSAYDYYGRARARGSGGRDSGQPHPTQVLTGGDGLTEGVAIDGRPVALRMADEGPGRALYFACKRCIDVVLAGSLLVLLSPLLALIAVLIKLDSPGPVIFAQERVGARRRSRDGQVYWEIRNFRCYKFRSMVKDADQSLHQSYIQAFVKGDVAPHDDGAGVKFKLTGDPRVTRVGRILRKTSLDELPQLVNVLKGEMSLVGPRPVPTYEVAEYRAKHYERLAALPGITGLWQVQARCQVSFEEMIDLDLSYIRRRSLWLDIKLLLLTIPAVLKGRGAD